MRSRSSVDAALLVTASLALAACPRPASPESPQPPTTPTTTTTPPPTTTTTPTLPTTTPTPTLPTPPPTTTLDPPPTTTKLDPPPTWTPPTEPVAPWTPPTLTPLLSDGPVEDGVRDGYAWSHELRHFDFGTPATTWTLRIDTGRAQHEENHARDEASEPEEFEPLGNRLLVQLFEGDAPRARFEAAPCRSFWLAGDPVTADADADGIPEVYVTYDYGCRQDAFDGAVGIALEGAAARSVLVDVYGGSLERRAPQPVPPDDDRVARQLLYAVWNPTTTSPAPSGAVTPPP